MLVGEDQAQHSMKIANWNNPEKSLELQPGDQESLAALLYNQAQAIAKQLHLTIPRAFPKPVGLNKISGLYPEAQWDHAWLLQLAPNGV